MPRRVRVDLRDQNDVLLPDIAPPQSATDVRLPALLPPDTTRPASATSHVPASIAARRNLSSVPTALIPTTVTPFARWGPELEGQRQRR